VICGSSESARGVMAVSTACEFLVLSSDKQSARVGNWGSNTY